MQFLLPRRTYRIVLQTVEQRRVIRTVGQFAGHHTIRSKARFGFGQRQVEIFQQPFPAQPDGVDVINCSLLAIADQDVGIERRVAAM